MQDNRNPQYSPSENTSLQEFFEMLAGGAQKKILEHVLTQTAKNVLAHGAKGRKGKVTIEIDFARLGDDSVDNGGLKVASKIIFKKPTQRGESLENETRESVLYLTRKGISDVPERKVDDVDDATSMAAKAADAMGKANYN